MALFTATVQSGQAAGTHANMPLLVDLSNLPASFWSTVTDGGGDIRVYTDAPQTNELAREVVSCDTGTETGVLYIKHDSVEDGAAVYIDVDGTRSDYAAGATYGRNAVWSDFVAVWHLNEASGDAIDSTGNGYDGTDTNTVGSVAGKIGTARNFVGANSEHFACGTAPTITDATISFWYKFTTNSTYGAFICKRGSNKGEFAVYENNTAELVGRVEDNSGNLSVTESNVITNTAGTFRHYVITIDASAAGPGQKYYQNAVSLGRSRVAASNATSIGTNTNPMFIGTLSSDAGVPTNFLNGAMEELRLYDGVHSANRVTTDYNNQNNNAAFWGTWGEITSGFKKATVAASEVAATLTDYPAYVDLSRLGITTLAEAQSVRVYADEAKTTELAREIVSASEMHVKIPSLTTTTSIYVDWDGVRSDYATSATYGRNAVWSDYEFVLHGDDLTSTTLLESTGNATFTQSGGSAVETTGKIGKAQNPLSSVFNTSYNGRTNIGTGDFTAQTWINFSTNTSRRNILTFVDSGDSSFFDAWTLQTGNSTTDGSDINAGMREGTSGYAEVTDGGGNLTSTWKLLHATRTGTTAELFVDATSVDTVTNAEVGVNLGTLTRVSGAQGSLQPINAGLIDEMRVKAAILSANWITTEYNNQSDEVTFWGTWTDAGGSSITKAIPVNAAKVAATLSDYPALVQPSLMTGWGAITLAEAQSIRFYSDEALTTELAREVVSADEIHVKVPSLTTSTIIYANYDGVRSDYATSATYGAQNVWNSSYLFVSHDGGVTDSTGNGNNSTNAGTTITASGKIGDAREYTSSTGYSILANFTSSYADEATFTSWIKLNNATPSSSSNNILGSYDATSTAHYPFTNGLVYIGFFRTARPSFTPSATVTRTDWHKVTVRTKNEANGWRFYQNDQLIHQTAAQATVSVTATSGQMVLGTEANDTARRLDGFMDEVRFSNVGVSEDWNTTEYNNQSDVSTFWGTVTDAGGGGGETAKNPLFVGGGI